MNLPKWIFFDCCDTLIDEREDSWGLTTVAHLPVEGGAFASREAFRDAYREWQRSRVAEGDWGEVSLPDRLRRFFEDHAVEKTMADDLAKSMSAAFRNTYLDTLYPTPGVREMLEAWHGKVGMGVVSNFFPADYPEHMLRHFGLDGFFDFVVDSDQIGTVKPGKAIYTAALEKAGNPAPGEVLFVGDNRRNDYEAPIALGMQAQHLHRSPSKEEDRPWEGFRPPDAPRRTEP